jgi:hypothetical protein
VLRILKGIGLSDWEGGMLGSCSGGGEEEGEASGGGGGGQCGLEGIWQAGVREARRVGMLCCAAEQRAAMSAAREYAVLSAAAAAAVEGEDEDGEQVRRCVV